MFLSKVLLARIQTKDGQRMEDQAGGNSKASSSFAPGLHCFFLCQTVSF